MDKLKSFNVKIFADGADEEKILQLNKDSKIRGFTTNPTLIKKSGATDYELHCKKLLKVVSGKPISFEVLSDDISEMRRQAKKIATWGDNVFCKIPVSNSLGESCADLISDLTKEGIKVNVTALFTYRQCVEIYEAIEPGVQCNISIFAGRVADIGLDAINLMKLAVDLVRPNPDVELIWASPRQVYNVIEAEEIGCHIITATPDILSKLPLIGYDPNKYSLDTVKMFLNDSNEAGFKL